MPEHENDHGPHGHDLGLSHDLPTMQRRRMLGMVGGTAAAVVGGIGIGADAQATTKLKVIPTETEGPYPADGSNGVNVLDDSGIVRSDLRKSFGTAAGTAAGYKLTTKLHVIKVSTGKVAKGLAVYLWHCNRDGNYSLYSEGLTDENYLRGIQVVNANGYVTFTSIFPACYAGRWPHIHFEVYPTLAKAKTYKNKLHTSQIAIPAAAATKVYANSSYSSSKKNFAQVSLKTDNVFKDGWTAETPTITGSTTKGFLLTLTVGV